MSHCPKCGYEQHCPCKHCKVNFYTDKKRWIWLKDDFIKCANCGHTAHCDVWLDYEQEEYKKLSKRR